MRGALLPPVRLAPAAVLGSLALALFACGSDSGDTHTSVTAPACADAKVDRFKELVVVDDAVLDDARAKNATDGVWSFRHAMENVAAPGGDASALVRAWLDEWVESGTFNGYPLDRPDASRAPTMQQRVVCPWLKRTPANACDDTCEHCTGQKLDLALAPFRLIAIVNRMDLRDEIAEEPVGESRLVFGIADGLGDDPAAPPLEMTVILEYFLPSTRSLTEWARAWHDLGRFAAFDESYRVALEGVTNAFTKRGSNPPGPNGSALAQIRTNETTLSWFWQQREFALDLSGAFHLRPLRNTPPDALNNSAQLRDYVVANAAAIKSNRFEMPRALEAGSSDSITARWTLPGVDEATRKAFAGNTCNGCHLVENPAVDTAFHVSPKRRGIEKLSPYMNDPSGKPDQLSHRAERLSSALCGQ